MAEVNSEEWTQEDEAELKQVNDEIEKRIESWEKEAKEKRQQRFADELNMPLAKYKQEFKKQFDKEYKAVFVKVSEKVRTDPKFKTDKIREDFTIAYSHAVSRVRAFFKLKVRAYAKARRIELLQRKREILLEKQLDQLSEKNTPLELELNDKAKSDHVEDGLWIKGRRT